MSFVSARSDDSSPLESSQRKHGTNSYYYAHNRSFHVPDDAMVVEGPGLITGGLPSRIESEPRSSASPSCRPPKSLSRYSWVDDERSIKIYIFKADLPSVDWPSLMAGEGFTLQATTQSVRFEITGEEPFRLHVSGLYAEIDADKCACKVSDSRIALRLPKLDVQDSWPRLRKA